MDEFVVYIVIYHGDKLPRYYVGSTTKEKIKNGYLGSIKSKKWKDIFKLEVKNYRNLFDVNIISTHSTRQEALLAEYKFQKENDVVKSPNFFNESFANINGYFGRDVNGESNPMYGRKNEVIAINVKTKEKVRVSKEEFINNHELSGHTVGLVYVLNRNTGEKVFIDKKDFDKTKYKHHNEGIKHSEALKEKLSKMRLGFITAKDWDGNFHRIHKDDVRLKNGEFGNTTSKRWVIEDLNGNIYKTFNFKKFFDDNNYQYPRPENIINGVIMFKQKRKKRISTNGWKITCLD